MQSNEKNNRNAMSKEESSSNKKTSNDSESKDGYDDLYSTDNFRSYVTGEPPRSSINHKFTK